MANGKINTDPSWPDLQQQWANRQIQQPNVTSGITARPMNRVEQMLRPDAQAITWPWGTISLNRDLINQQHADLSDVLVHELTHVGQNQQKGLSRFWQAAFPNKTPYEDRPEEQEAFQAEKNRKVIRGDIYLRPAKK